MRFRNTWKYIHYSYNMTNVLHYSKVVIHEAHALDLWVTDGGGGGDGQGGSLGYAWPMRMQQKTLR